MFLFFSFYRHIICMVLRNSSLRSLSVHGTWIAVARYTSIRYIYYVCSLFENQEVEEDAFRVFYFLFYRSFYFSL